MTGLVDDRTADILWGGYFVLVLVTSFCIWRYFRRTDNVQLKRKVVRWSNVIGSILISLLIMLSWGVALGLVIGPLNVLIVYYQRRKTRICSACGTENEYRALISGPADKCGKCRASLAEIIAA